MAADLPRKLLGISAGEASALTAACPRLTLMLYELGRDAVVSQARTALAWVKRGGVDVVVGLRVSDFGDQTDQVVSAVDMALAGAPGYAGWALHDYAAAQLMKR